MITFCNIFRSAFAITNVIALTLGSHLADAAQILIQTGDPQLPGVVTSTWRSEAGDAVGQSERVALRIQTMLKPMTREVRGVREMLNLRAMSQADSS